VLTKARSQLRYRRALRSLVKPPASDPAYHSAFGGLWTDRRDAADEIDRRLEAGAIAPADAEVLRRWIRDGYVILERAVEPAVCDLVRNDLERAFREGDERVLMFLGGDRTPLRLPAGADIHRTRVVDVYVFYESARRALFSDPILRFLRTVFDDDPLLFQSLTFETGSQQPMHQDTGFVVVSSPLEFAASWIALEDIQPGSGELTYIEGSHRLPEYLFSGKYKHWNAKRDGDAQHAEWHRQLHQNSEQMGLEQKTFLPKKGDVLMWAADLAHGGSPVTDPSLTRKSLVGHYCPNRVEPFYFKLQPDRRGKREHDRSFFASQYYAA
jgi:ectoine hydroxylase-related dioxygenase (phytanoyl-CoA dioxygenase family)